MRSIEARFKRVEIKNPNLGAYSCLARAVTGKNYSRKSLVKIFKEVMPKDEYVKSDTKQMINNLEQLSKLSEEVEFEGKNLLGEERMEHAES